MSEIPNSGARDDVGRRSAKSGAVQIGAQAVLLLLSLGSGLALARLLVPNDFGVVAMASILTSFVTTLRGFGFSMALVQAAEIADDDLQRLFRVGVRYTLWLGLGMLATAPLLAWLYHEPRLTAVIAATIGGSMALSLAELPEALAMRAMRFTALRRIEVGSVAIGMAVGLTAAWLGAGYWALVMQSAMTACARAGMAWRLVPWRPRWRDGATSRDHSPTTHAMLAFARRYAATNVITFAAQNLDRMTIAVSGGTYAMGLYDVAYRWGHYPVWQLYPPLLNVAVAGLSRSRDDHSLYRHYWRTAVLLVLSTMLPALTFFAIEARTTILTLLGNGWTDAIEVFRFVTIGAMAMALSRHTRWLFLAEGRTSAQLRMSAVQLIVTAVAMAIGARWNLLGIATAYAVARWIVLLPELALAFEQSPVGWYDYTRAVWRPLAASALAGIALVLSGPSLPSSAVQRLVIGALVCGSAYLIAWLALPGGIVALRELLGVARRARERSPTE